MKTILILFLAITTVFASAMSMHRPIRKPMPHPATTRPVVTKRPANTTHPVEVKRPVNTTHPVETTRPVEKSNPVSWKTVAAGGAAAGTVVAAYKLSDGVEEGMKTAAEKAPVTFLSSITLSSIILPVVLVIGIPLAGFFILTQLSH